MSQFTAAPPPSTRASGILLHPTSLPGDFGIGDFGPAAYRWIEALAHARQKYWQILPLGPTGFGDSPYQSFSAFAGNPYLISPQFLHEDGLLDQGELAHRGFDDRQVDFANVIPYKLGLLDRAWQHFQQGRAAHLRVEFERFIQEQAGWLDDYALFMTLKDLNRGTYWVDWPAPARLHDAAFLQATRNEHAGHVGAHQFRQFVFYRQWRALRQHARQHGVKLIGDIPIFVSGDSSDVWANPQLFALDDDRRPKFVAGVPPDYFSATGQLWGNPLYDWAALEQTGFAWWLARFKAMFQLVDVVRLDHFRGFESYWEVPASAPNAIHGRWVQAPGRTLFDALRRELGSLPLIAEDLGLITPEVDALRLDFNLPGMRVLQFAWGEKPDHRYLPHNYDTNTVVYTGTHDNDTTLGWFHSTEEKNRDHLRRYTARGGEDIAWDMIRLAWASVADLAIAPLQDVLSLGNEARMNFPGQPIGNWSWRVQPHQLRHELLDRLAEMTTLYGRS